MSVRLRPSLLLIAASAALVLADASVVALALPQLLGDLHTGVEGVAAVLGVYTLVLALALLPAAWLVRRHGARLVGATGFATFALASLACALSSTLPSLLVARGVQAAGGAAGLLAAFVVLEAPTRGRRAWLVVVVFGAAVGPALGGALTEAFDWHAIFIAQAPLAAIGGLVVGRARPTPLASPASRFPLVPGVALGLVSAALTAVLFLLVLELVAGWGVHPLVAALGVTVLPLAALASARVTADPRTRAIAGCLLVGAGTLCLAFLPGASVWWTVPAQLLAGAGMGLTLPALAGEMLPERNVADASRLLSGRHLGIVVALVALAPIVSTQLDNATRLATERGVALVLDAPLPIQTKLALGPSLAQGVGPQDPRGQIRRALAGARANVAAGDLPTFEHLRGRADDIVVAAIGDAFRTAFLVSGLLALLAAAVLLVGAPLRRVAPALAALIAVPAYIALHTALAPGAVPLRNACLPRALPPASGLTGGLQGVVLTALDRAACRFGSTREELVLAVLSGPEAARFQREHHVDPTSLAVVLQQLLG